MRAWTGDVKANSDGSLNYDDVMSPADREQLNAEEKRIADPDHPGEMLPQYVDEFPRWLNDSRYASERAYCANQGKRLVAHYVTPDGHDSCK
jgi:hypothetical protein